jgi:hypothetical protein
MRKWLLNGLIELALRRRPIVFGVSILLSLVLGAASARVQLDVRWTTLLPGAASMGRRFPVSFAT